MDKQTFLSSYEKDGYQVIDSFIYDDIKTFLERNKPRKNHIIGIVFISGFFILFFIGFAMGKLWSDSLSFSQFGIQILKCVVFSILDCALIIPVHEFIHWIAYKKRVLMMYVLEPSGSHLCFMQPHIILRPIIKLFDE